METIKKQYSILRQTENLSTEGIKTLKLIEDSYDTLYLELREFKRKDVRIKDRALYTFKQVCELMGITRSWVLNDLSGPIPYLPKDVEAASYTSELYSTMPPYKKVHKVVRFLMWLHII